jgi:hypothetical protein
MTLAAFGLFILALGLAWWVMRRATAFRREAELREARALDALFAARQSADRGADIDLDRIFGGTPGSPAPAGADAALRAEVAALLNVPPAGQSGQADPVARSAPARIASASAEAAQAPAQLPPVRDLVQVFYEARGFRPASVDPAARPIEAVLAHAADAQRAYAFAPLAQPPSAATLRSIVERARGIGQKRVLVSVEGGAVPDAGQPAHGVRVLDRSAIEAQLARLESTVAERIRARARQRAGKRLGAT